MAGISSPIGSGIYSLREAALLSSVPVTTLRRWLIGYSYRTDEGVSHQPPGLPRDRSSEKDEVVTVTFQDLLEIRFVQAFRSIGVSWNTIKLAADKARKRFNTIHPFTTERFASDGRSIFEQLREEGVRESRVVDLVKDQYCFRDVILPGFRAQIDLTAEGAERWWPMGRKKKIVLDPARQLGRPIIADASIPTAVLSKAVVAMGSEQLVARWYEVSKASVRQAVIYERQLHA
jgi:uncharacterized protein (DUF433 family)/DNA-binding transcriptional MerR regulator